MSDANYDVSVVLQKFIDAGFSFVPVAPGTKVPDAELIRSATGESGWKSFQSRVATEAEIRVWTEAKPQAIGVVCGAVSGGLLVIDFDVPGFFERWRSMIPQELAAKLAIQKTGSGNHQVWVRCADPGRNQKLAWAKNNSEASGREVAIETRGEGGYAIAAPSIHPSGNRYEVIHGNLAAPPFLEKSDVTLLLDAAKNLTELPIAVETPTAHDREDNRDQGDSVIEAFNAANKIEDMLLKYGYTRSGDRFIRPGGSSESVTIQDGKSFHHSTNDPMDNGYWRSAFDLFCQYEHAENLREAVKAAAQLLGIRPEADDTQRLADAKEFVAEILAASDLSKELGVTIFERKNVELLASLYSLEFSTFIQFIEQLAKKGLSRSLCDRISTVVKKTAGELSRSVDRTRRNFFDDVKSTPSGYAVLNVDIRGQRHESLISNFTARIVDDLLIDDGVETSRFFNLLAKVDGRERTVQIPADEFDSLDWLVPKLGGKATLASGRGVRDQVRMAIQKDSQNLVERSAYAHLGWREVNGQWLFLTADGPIGTVGTVSGVDTILSPNLSHYILPAPPTGAYLMEAIQKSFEVLALAPDRIIFPLFASVFRAILGLTDFSIHLFGITGCRKTSIAAIFQQFFGAGMDSQHLPGSWSSTANSNEMLAFQAKDCLLVLDDFAPGGGQFDMQKMQRDADRIFRGQGNGSGRARLTRDGKLKPSKPPRGLILSTGEDVPQGASVQARVLGIELRPEDVDLAKLSACQELARQGVFASVTAAFIQYLSPSISKIQTNVPDQINQWRAYLNGANMHSRTPGILANLVVGFNYFLHFARQVGAIDDSQLQSLSQRMLNAVVEIGQHQTHLTEATDIAKAFIDNLRAALTAGECHCCSSDGERPVDCGRWGWHSRDYQKVPQGEMVGWVAGEDLYLDPLTSFAAAKDMAQKTGFQLTVTPETLKKRLRDANMLRTVDKTRQRLTIRITLEGTRRDVLHLSTDSLYPREPSQPSQPPQLPASDSKEVGNV